WAWTCGGGPGCVAVVLVRRLCRRLLDDHHHPRRRLPRRPRRLGLRILPFGRTGTPPPPAARGVAPAVVSASACVLFLSGGLALRFAGQPAVWPPPARARPFPGQGSQTPFDLLGFDTSHVPR